MPITTTQIAAILNDLGYVLGVLSGGSFFANIHPEAAEYLGIASIASLGLANRIDPPTATPAPVPSPTTP